MKKVGLSLVLIAIMGIGAARAAEGPAARPVTINLEDAPLTEALKQVGEASGLKLTVPENLVEAAKPVTLKTENEPASDVLHRMLRPRGLEVVHSSDTEAEVVAAASDIGVAKAAGRALRTLARLARKLEAAEQHGDEVRVPGWTAADDRALARAVTDLHGLGLYSELNWEPQALYPGGHRGPPDKLMPPLGEVEQLIKSPDPDVRAGLGAAVAVAWKYRQAPPPEHVARIVQTISGSMDDPDPLVRACWLYALLRLRFLVGAGWAPLMASMTDAASEDPAPEVRYAAAFVRDFADLESLRKDDSAAVRLAAWMSWLRLIHEPPNAALRREVEDGLLADKNPIVRSLGLIRVCLVWKRHTTQMDELLRKLDLEKDPRLKALADAFLPLLTLEDRPAEPAALSRRLPGSFGIREPAATLVARWFLYGERQRHRRQNFERLWSGLFGRDPKGKDDPAAARGRLVGALQSGDEATRIAALLDCVALPQKSPSPDLKKAVVALLGAPVFAESALAARAMPRVLSFDELLALFEKEAKRDPRAPSTKLLLAQFSSREDLAPEDAELGIRRQVSLFDTAVEPNDPGLQMYFVDRMKKHKFFLENKPLLLCLVYDTDPQVFRSILTKGFMRSRTHGYWISPVGSVMRAILHRLKTMFDGEDPVARRLAVAALTDLITYDRRAYPGRSDSDPWLKTGGQFYSDDVFVVGARIEVMNLIGRMLDQCINRGQTDEDIASGLTLLQGVVGDSGPMAWGTVSLAHPPDEVLREVFDVTRQPPEGWQALHRAKVLPPVARKAAIRALDYANDDTHGAQAAAVLGSLLLQGSRGRLALTIQKDPELLKAMDAARRRIVDEGTPEDQVAVLRGLVASKQEEVARPAVAELEKRILEGNMPAGRRHQTAFLIGNRTEFISSEFKQYLLARIADPNEWPSFRLRLIRVVAGCPDQRAPLIDTLKEVVAKNRWTLDFYSPVQRLVRGAQTGREGMGGPNASWIRKAAELGRMVALDATKPVWRRGRAMDLYVVAAGRRAAEMIEAALLDETLPTRLRSTAALRLTEVSPATRLFVVLAEKYDTLPFDVRNSLAGSAIRSPQLTGAEAFAVRFLRDPKMKRQIVHRLGSLELPPTPALMAALRDLQADPEIAPHVKQAILRLNSRHKK